MIKLKNIIVLDKRELSMSEESLLEYYKGSDTPRNNTNHTTPASNTLTNIVSTKKVDYISAVSNSTASFLAVSTALRSTTPLGMVMAAVTSATPIIMEYLKDKPEDKDCNENDASEIAKNYINQRAITESIADELGFKFQPGHPQINIEYALHPLANYNKNYNDLYIPIDSFNEILYEERESELIKLLVALGATKITITTRENFNHQFNLHLSTEAETTIGGNKQGKIEGQYDRSQMEDNKKERVYELSGKKVKHNDDINSLKLTWLDHEPTWKSLVDARLVGACRKAELELKEKTSFSSKNGASLSLGSALFNASSELSQHKLNDKERTHSIKIEFNELIQQE